MTCRSNIAKIVQILKSKMAARCHLEKLFFASSPDWKDQLTQNLVGSIKVTCRSKIAKIVLIGNPKMANGGHLENLFFASSPEPKGQMT